MRLGPAEVRFTGRQDGDFGSAEDRGPIGPSPATIARRRSVVDREWTWLRQVHGSQVVVVDRPGGGAGTEGDAAVTTHRGAALAVLTADCAPVALASPEGVVAVVHAGWRGLLGGVIGRTTDSMAQLGSSTILAAIGASIGPECYEFSAADLDPLATQLGDRVRSVDARGRPALDLRAGVREALSRAGAEVVHQEQACTACGADRYYSHRARGEAERQATVVWLP